LKSFSIFEVSIILGDALAELSKLDTQSVQCCVTSPPYWCKRNYNHPNQIGLEKTPELFISKLTDIFEEVRRVLHKDGTLWIIIGDTRLSNRGEAQRTRVKDQSSLQARSYQADLGATPNRVKLPGYKEKDLVGIPFMLAFALRDAGWYWRQINIWNKPNAFTESVEDRTGDSHEFILHFSKAKRYYYDNDAIKQPASPLTIARLKHGWHGADGREYKRSPFSPDRNQAQINRTLASKSAANGDSLRVNKRSVWTVGVVGFAGDHHATFPPDLIKPCILAGSKPGDVILDPFAGSGTTGMVALELGRRALLIELNPAYVALCKQRCSVTPGLPLGA